MAQNGRHGLRGVSARNPSEFEGVQDDDDNLTYTVDMASYLGTDTISSVTRVPWGLTVSNSANTTTQITQRLKGFGYVDIKASLASGDVEKFRIYILQRTPTATGTQDYIEVPVATTATRDPTTSDDSTLNFVAGNLWINTATQNEFTCISNSTAAAVWRHKPRTWQGGNLSLTGTTSETILATITLAAGVMGATGRLETDSVWTTTNNANNKTYRIRLGGIAGTEYLSLTTNSVATFAAHKEIQNLTASSQIGGVQGNATAGGYGAVTAANVTSAVDTSAATTLVFTGQLTNGGDTIALASYRVTLTRPDIA